MKLLWKWKMFFYFCSNTWKPMPSKTMDLVKKTTLHHNDKPFLVWRLLGLCLAVGLCSNVIYDFLERGGEYEIIHFPPILTRWSMLSANSVQGGPRTCNCNNISNIGHNILFFLCTLRHYKMQLDICELFFLLNLFSEVLLSSSPTFPKMCKSPAGWIIFLL